jgi:MHS family alpha-ketoglutarate permease-like MFS transporter
LADTNDPTIALLLVLIPLLILSAYTSISAVVKAELFPAYCRALGVALPYAIANSLFGGTAEFAALWFKEQGVEAAFYFYVAGVASIALFVSIFMRDTQRTSLIKED